MKDSRQINHDKFFTLPTSQNKMVFLLQYAIFSPSTHNTQPWLFKLGKDYCDIYYDPSKKLPHTDKSDRNLYISIGCCMENLIIAAKYFNVFKKEEIFLKDNHIGRIYFDFSTKKIKIYNDYKYLLEAIPMRSNRRGIFESKKVSQNILNLLREVSKEYPNSFLQIVDEKEQKNQIRDLSRRGIYITSRDANFRKEIGTWINSNISKKKEGMPGYVFKLPLLPSLIFPLLIKTFNLGEINGKMVYNNIESSSALCIITSKDDDKKAWLQAGKLAERLLLEIQHQNVHTTINVAPIEVEQLRGELQQILNTKKYPHFLFAIGYMNGLQKPTPRTNVADKIII